MAGEKVSGLPTEAVAIADDDLFLISKDLGASFESQRIKGSTLNSLYFSNMGNSNLVSTVADRYFEVTGSTTSDKWGVRAPLSATNNFEVTGDGECRFGAVSKPVYFGQSTTSYILNSPLGGQAFLANFQLFNPTMSTPFNFNNQNAHSFGNIYLGAGIVGNGADKMSVGITAVEPTTNIANVFDYYAKDANGSGGGNACPWWKTSNGDYFNLFSIGGWGNPTGTLTRTSFDTATVTLPQLAERVAAMIDDFRNQYQLFKA